MRISSRLWKYSAITLGSVLFALAFNLFLTPNRIAPGGVSGIAVVIHYLIGLPVGVMIILMNIPLFLLSYLKFGGSFLFTSAYATILSSVVIDVSSTITPFTEDPFLASVYGGVLMGAGLGLVFNFGATTGGSDMLSRLMKLRFPHIRMGRMLLFIDVAVIAVSAMVFRDANRALYAMVALYISSKVIDMILYGTDYDKLAYIISDKSDEISRQLQIQLNRGVTLVYGEGGYTRKQKKIIICALKRQQASKAAKIAAEIDPEAFVIMIAANEILGDGFQKSGS